jgi:hypothetical protein
VELEPNLESQAEYMAAPSESSLVALHLPRRGLIRSERIRKRTDEMEATLVVEVNS